MQAGAEPHGDGATETSHREAFAGVHASSDAAMGADRAVGSDESTVSDESLMAAYRDSNDTKAFERLYRRHRNGLYRYLLRQCGAAALAEELFQDVWVGLIRGKHQYVVEARFATYLYKVAHNRLIDHYRRAVHRPSIAIANDDADPVDSLPAEANAQPDVKYAVKQQVERFSLLLAALPESQREAFVLHEEAGLSVNEIAESTGVNPETAKSRLRYALARLRRGMLEWA